LVAAADKMKLKARSISALHVSCR